MRRFVFLLLAALPAAAADPPPGVADGLKAIRSVGPEGAGSEAASKGWKAVVSAGTPALVPTLTAFDDATPVAANWLRSAVNAIAEKEEKAGKTLSKTDLGTFAADTTRNPTARRLAFEMLAKLDAKAADALLADFLNDPSPDLRRDAVAAALKDADALSRAEARWGRLEKLFGFARDQDQVEAIGKKLKAEGKEMNTTKHFGYVTQWAVSKDFDNKEGKGFGVAHPPETQTDRGGWTPHQTSDEYGSIDVNKLLGDKKDVLAYAAAVIVADADTKCQVRLASKNAIKVFVNGKEVYGKDEYHHGHKMDQHRAEITLNKGKNEVLVKVCQNDRAQPWMKEWEFSLRVCDATGGKLALKQAITTDGNESTVDLGELAPAPTKKEEKK